jgi:hypothetical protein
LKFQERIDETNNARKYEEQFVLSQTSDELILSTPEIYPDSGTITFFRPSDTRLDRTFNIQPDSLWTMRIPVSGFIKGKYILKVHWKQDNQSFYVEKPFYFK